MLSCGMHCALLDAGYFDHWLPSCCLARFSSIRQAFTDCVFESPAVAAKSSLHVRVTSNTGTPLATATTSCELKAIIETDIAILVTPCPTYSGRHPEEYFNGNKLLSSMRNRTCSADSFPDHSTYLMRAGPSCLVAANATLPKLLQILRQDSEFA